MLEGWNLYHKSAVFALWGMGALAVARAVIAIDGGHLTIGIVIATEDRRQYGVQKYNQYGPNEVCDVRYATAASMTLPRESTFCSLNALIAVYQMVELVVRRDESYIKTAVVYWH